MAVLKYHLLIALILFASSCMRTERVVEVIDGDTFKTKGGAVVRLLGVNTPEMSEPGGDLAKDCLTFLVLNKEVRLQSDITDQDDYNRELRYVFLGDKFVNAELVRMGYAEARFYPPDTFYKNELEELEKVAIRNHRGLWSFPVFQIPDTTGTAEKGMTGKVGDIKSISWQDAAKYYGRVMVVEGKTVATNNTGKVCFLNFDQDWRRSFTAVIFASDFDKFPPNPEDYYLNRTVRVTGLIKEYKNKPEIIIKSPDQIVIIE